jgi:YggT family protein
MSFIAQLLNLYSFAILGRVVLSWFPVTPGTAMATIYSFLYTITEPVLGPLRRVIPGMGGLDLSPIIALVGIRVLAGILLSSG